LTDSEEVSCTRNARFIYRKLQVQNDGVKWRWATL